MSEEAIPRRLPRRDWLLLPLIALTTVLLLMMAGEGVARIFWPQGGHESCFASTTRHKANCVERVKYEEGSSWIESSFNECGYRATGPCSAPAPDGRIAILGSSTSWAYRVDFADSWSVQAARRLGAACGHQPDVQSVSSFDDLNDIARKLPETLKLKPSLVVLVIMPFDLFKMPEIGFDPEHAADSNPNGAASAAKGKGLMDWVRDLSRDLRATQVAQQFMYLNPERFSSIYLNYGDKADFMRPPFTPAWQRRVAYVDDGINYISQRLAEAHVPLLVAFAPQQAQADILGAGLSYPGVDANALTMAVQKIADRHGALFTDGTAFFVGRKDAPTYFYRVDGHLNGKGQRALGAAVAQTILASHIPGLCDDIRQ